MLDLKSDSYKAWYNKAVALTCLHRYTEALAALESTLTIKASCYYAWNYRGMVLAKLGRYDESLRSFERSLRLRPGNSNALYGKSCCYALQSNVEQAIAHLKEAIDSSPYLCRLMAKTDPSFGRVRQDPRFQALVQVE